MNFNEYILNRGMGRGKKGTRGKSHSVLAGKKAMGPPLKPPPRKKESTTTTSSELNWGKSHISVPNTPSLHKTMSSSKSSTESESKVVVAITEGRGEARCEVGIAAINVSKPHLILCQISDTQSYINTLTKINIFNPNEIVMPQTFVENLTAENRLINIIRKQFPRVKYTSVARSIFNKTNGMEMLKQLCIESSSPILLALAHRYYALSAASALLTYTQENLYIYYAKSTINVDYQESEGYAIIDVLTADRLELVSSTRPEQANRYSSLFGVLNNCLTKIGSRSLRSIILQPLCFVEKIEERLMCVSELYMHPQTLISIQAILQKIPNIDMLLTLATIITADPQKCSTRQLNYVLLLNSLVDLIAPLKEVLRNCKHPFYRRFHGLLEGEEFSVMKDSLRKIIQEDAYPAKGSAANLQRMFAIKAGVNGLLDLVRKTYTERIEDMIEYVKKLGEKYDLPLTLGNNNTKGYHIVLNLNQQQKRFMKKSDLPEEFIQVYRLAGSFTMKTPELVNLSIRIDDVMDDIIKISNVMIHSMIIEVKNYMGLFFKLCENIAYLDVLQSLAETSRQNNYVRPKFDEYTELVHCYHPILDYLCSTKITSNPIGSSREFNVHVVTGPNGSGKSVYIRQVALVQVMAQLGCYVPASSATLRPADRIYARIYLEDDMEADSSAFVLEMKELKYIMATMTDKSLILIDEPCRSTSLEEGTALALAICEKLALTSAFLYITTHFTLLTKLYDMYLNVKVWQMDTTVCGDNPKNMKLDYKYNVLHGVTSVGMHGLHLVPSIWPEGVLKYVYQTLETFNKPRDPKICSQDERLRLKYNLEYELQKLKTQKKLTLSEINKYLNEYQDQLQKVGINDIIGENNLHIPRIYHQILEDSRSNESLQGQGILDNCQDYVHEGSLSNDAPENVQVECFSERQLQEFAATSKAHEMIDQRISEVFTPENSQHNIIMDRVSETSSYRNICEFIREDSRNAEKLIPKINLHYSDNSRESEDHFAGNAFGLFGLDHRSSNSDASFKMSEIVRQKLVEEAPLMRNQTQISEQHEFHCYEDNILSGSDVSKQMSEIVRQKLSEEMSARHQSRSNILGEIVRQKLVEEAPLMRNQSQISEQPEFRCYEDNILSGSDVSKQMSEIVRQKLSEEMSARHQSRSNNLLERQTFRIANDFVKPTFGNTQVPAEHIFTEDIFAPSDCPHVHQTRTNQTGQHLYSQSPPENACSKLHSPDNQSSSNTTHKSSSLELPRDMNDFKFSLPLQYDATKTSTPVIRRIANNQLSAFTSEDFCNRTFNAVILNNTANLDNDNESILEELEECSRLLEDDDSFGDKDESANSETPQDNQEYNTTKQDNDMPNSQKTERNETNSQCVEFQQGTNNKSLSLGDEDAAYFTQTNLPKPLIASQKNTEVESDPILISDRNSQSKESIVGQRKSQYRYYISPKVYVVECMNDTTLSFGEEDKPYVPEEAAKKSSIQSSLPVECLARNTADEIGTDDVNKDDLRETHKIGEGCTGHEKHGIGEETMSYSPLENPPLVSLNETPSKQEENQNGGNEQTSKVKEVEICMLFDSGNMHEHIFHEEQGNVIKQQDIEIQSPLENSFSKMRLRDDDVINENNNSSLVANKFTINCQESNVSTSSPTEESKLQNSGVDDYATAESHNDQPDSTSDASFKSSKSNSNVAEYGKQEHTTVSGVSSASRKRNLDHATSSSKSETSLSSASRKRNIDQVAFSQEDEDPRTVTKSGDLSGGTPNQDSRDSTSSRKESDSSQPKKKKRLGYRLRRLSEGQGGKNQSNSDSSKDKKKAKRPQEQMTFLEPKKLSIRQINEEFLEQDRKILDSSGEFGISKYLNMIKNRPTAHQVKATMHLATIRKTTDGLEVIPAKNKKRKRKDLQLQRCFSEETVDVSIFSDKNAKPFEEFIKSDEKNYKTFNFTFTKNQEKIREERGLELFQAKSPCEQSYDGVKTFTTNFVRTKSTDIFKSQDSATKGDDTLTPDGFYKENRSEIDKIMKRFLKSP